MFQNRIFVAAGLVRVGVVQVVRVAQGHALSHLRSGPHGKIGRGK